MKKGHALELGMGRVGAIKSVVGELQMYKLDLLGV
jgi:hypothetical protein